MLRPSGGTRRILIGFSSGSERVCPGRKSLWLHHLVPPRLVGCGNDTSFHGGVNDDG